MAHGAQLIAQDANCFAWGKHNQGEGIVTALHVPFWARKVAVG